LLSTVAVAATLSYTSSATGPYAVASATVHGYATAFWWAAAIFAIGAIVSGVVLPSGRPEPSELDRELASPSLAT